MADDTATSALGIRPAGDDLWADHDLDERQLLEHCRQGDMRAFSILVEKYQDRLFNAVFRLCGNYQDACELSQEAFLRALKNIGNFRGQAKFYTWLFRISLNLVRSHHRRAGKRRYRSLDESDGTMEIASQALKLAGKNYPSPAEQAEQAERNDKVMAGLGRLAQQYRVVIVLRDIDGMDYQEISEILRVPVGTVKSRIHRGRLTLREYLKDVLN